MKKRQNNMAIEYVPISVLKPAQYNPRKWDKVKEEQLKQSVSSFGMVDPLIVNGAPNRKNVVIGGHFRLHVAKQMGFKEMPVVYVRISDIAKEKELNVRLNKNTGDWNWDMLADFDETFLANIGFSSEELDEAFGPDDISEIFDLQKELQKLNIHEISVQKGDIYDLDGSRLMCGDSTVEFDILKLMGKETASMCMTDPPYLLDYLRGKTKNGRPTEGFGLKKNRKYLETDVLPPDFSDQWMTNVAKIQKLDFSIIVFEHPKNLRTIWNALEKHWKYRNTITWHVPNRVQGFSAKYKFFNKQDIALVGSSGDIKLNHDPEGELFQNEYENALFATAGRPHWEGYKKGKKICPTDFIEHIAADKKSSGQSIIFGTKPLELLIPYIKVLTKRGDLVLEPFGGSGSTLIASIKLGRRCYLMEKSPVYSQVILKRWEKLTGLKPKKI